jgi:hypothetical protein
MNWQSDQQLETLIAELEQLASQPTGKRKRDPGPLDQVLGDIIDLCYADARMLAEPHRMGALEHDRQLVDGDHGEDPYSRGEDPPALVDDEDGERDRGDRHQDPGEEVRAHQRPPKRRSRAA